ncbi:Putative Amine oxidase [Rhizopus microsporus]|nr:Putative Amine oxidase [Rhizopus microsporus]
MSAVKEMKTVTAATTSSKVHPLDQLSGDEIIQVAAIARQAKPEIDFVFNTITLKEPKKEVMLSYLGWDNSGPRVTQVEREALVVALEKKTMKCFKGLFSLSCIDNVIQSHQILSVSCFNDIRLG